MRQMKELTQEEFDILKRFFGRVSGIVHSFNPFEEEEEKELLLSALTKIANSFSPAYIPTRAEYEAVIEQSGAGSSSAYSAIVAAGGNVNLAVMMLRDSGKPIVSLKFRKEDEDSE